MDLKLQERTHRMQHALAQNNTTQHWQLFLTAIEAAFIDYFELIGEHAAAQRGRATVSVKRKKADTIPRSGTQQSDAARLLCKKAAVLNAQARRMGNVAARTF